MASKHTKGGCQRPGFVTVRASPLPLAAILPLALIYLLPSSAVCACWKIEADGATIVAADIWQVRNRVSGEATLLGHTGEQRHAVSVEKIESLTVAREEKPGWLSGKHGAVEMAVRLIDGQTIAMMSEMNLYYVSEKGKRQDIPLRDVTSVQRCAGPPPAASPIGEAKGPGESLPGLTMKNGDILVGEVSDDQLLWQTSYAIIEFRPADLRVLRMGCKTPPTGTLETLAGDLLKGQLADKGVSFRLTTGQAIEIPTEQIEMIDFVGMNVAAGANTDQCDNDQ